VVAKDGAAAGDALADELRRFVAAELADYKRPRRVIFVDQIPRNPTGKIEKRILREQAQS
jgi:acyl-coenzyme A synthetase/AMP-(fatty) acid ligase